MKRLRMKNTYRLLKQDSELELMMDVECHHAYGWRTQGGATCDDEMYYQAMIHPANIETGEYTEEEEVPS